MKFDLILVFCLVQENISCWGELTTAYAETLPPGSGLRDIARVNIVQVPLATTHSIAGFLRTFSTTVTQ